MLFFLSKFINREDGFKIKIHKKLSLLNNSRIEPGICLVVVVVVVSQGTKSFTKQISFHFNF